MTSCWNRHVTKQLRQTEEYPNFKDFADFVAQETEIACNPVTSFYALKPTEEKTTREVKHPKANRNVRVSEKSGTAIETHSTLENSSKLSNGSKKVNIPLSHACAVEKATPSTNART